MIARDPTHRSTRQTELRGGFTLIELVVTIAITSVIMLGIASAMLIAGHAVPDANNPVAAGIAAGNVLEQMATELQYAVSIIDSNATVIEFTVADRDGNDVPEAIRYEWSGAPGDPLTRQYNGNAAVEVLDAVETFSMSYDVVTRSEEVTSDSESGETLLIEYNSTQSLADYVIESAASYGQYFLPVLPPDAVSWTVTRIQFNAKLHGPTKGESRIQLQLASGTHGPTGAVLEERTLLESTLGSGYLVQEVTCSNASALSPAQGLCLLVEWVAEKHACDVQGQSAGVTTANSHLIQSTDQGASWSSAADQSLLYSVFGTVTTRSTQVQDVHYLKLVDIELGVGADPESIVSVSTRTLNTPTVTP